MTAPRVWPPVLDWSDGAVHWGGTLAACVLCDGPTPLRSDRDEPCHKTCAEAWFAQHPLAWAAYEARRDRPARRNTPTTTRPRSRATSTPTANVFPLAA